MVIVLHLSSSISCLFAFVFVFALFFVPCGSFMYCCCGMLSIYLFIYLFYKSKASEYSSCFNSFYSFQSCWFSFHMLLTHMNTHSCLLLKRATPLLGQRLMCILCLQSKHGDAGLGLVPCSAPPSSLV